MADEIYRELQKRLDMYSLGFPATKSSIEIRILKKLFGEEDVNIFMALSPRLEDPASVAARLGKPVEGVSKKLEDMARRGLLFRLKKGDSSKYGAIPFMHGLVEFQIGRFDRGMAEMLEEYFNDGFFGAIAGAEGLFLRTVPVQQSVTPEHRVAPFDDACGMLRKADIIAVADCICRKGKESRDEGCGKPLETCFMFGSMARYYIDYGLGREIGVDEAVRILSEAQEAGLVTQPATAQNPSGMCNCCGDCCGVLRAVKTHPRPSEIVYSNYLAKADGAACTGCESCLERCQMDAISMDAAGAVAIDRHRCIGCGLCVTACPAGALSLEAKPAEGYRTPPATAMEQMMTLAKKRGLL